MSTNMVRVASKARSSALMEKLRKDEGLSTAEYAVGTVAAAGLGGVLIKILASDEVRNLIWSVVSTAFKSLMG